MGEYLGFTYVVWHHADGSEENLFTSFSYPPRGRSPQNSTDCATLGGFMPIDSSDGSLPRSAFPDDEFADLLRQFKTVARLEVEAEYVREVAALNAPDPLRDAWEAEMLATGFVSAQRMVQLAATTPTTTQTPIPTDPATALQRSTVDCRACRAIQQQLDGLHGARLRLPPSLERDLREKLDTAWKTDASAAYEEVVLRIWDHAWLRRQPWVTGIKSLAATKRYASWADAAATILVDEVANNLQVAHLTGHDRSGWWIPDLVLDAIWRDLDLSPAGGWTSSARFSMGPHPAHREEAITTLLDAFGTGHRPVAIQSAHWLCFVPGWYLPFNVSPAQRALTIACRNTPDARHSRLAKPGSTGLYPPTRHIPARIDPCHKLTTQEAQALLAWDAAETSDALRLAVASVAPERRHLFLATPLGSSAAWSMLFLLAKVITVFLATGLQEGSEPIDGHVMYRATQPCEPYAPIYLIRHQGHLLASHSLITSTLTAIGLFPPAAMASGGGATRDWSWFTGDGGLGPLLADAWPVRANGPLPTQVDWLILPPGVATLLNSILDEHEAQRSDAPPDAP